MPRERRVNTKSRAQKAAMRLNLIKGRATRSANLAAKKEPELEIIELDNENRNDEVLEIAANLGLCIEHFFIRFILFCQNGPGKRSKK